MKWRVKWSFDWATLAICCVRDFDWFISRIHNSSDALLAVNIASPNNMICRSKIYDTLSNANRTASPPSMENRVRESLESLVSTELGLYDPGQIVSVWPDTCREEQIAFMVMYTKCTVFGFESKWPLSSSDFSNRSIRMPLEESRHYSKCIGSFWMIFSNQTPNCVQQMFCHCFCWNRQSQTCCKNGYFLFILLGLV